jgi:hypothetical protein
MASSLGGPLNGRDHGVCSKVETGTMEAEKSKEMVPIHGRRSWMEEVLETCRLVDKAR